MSSSITRTMVINDVHIPYHDSRLINIEAGGLVLDIFDECNIERLIINGDLLDFYSVNMHGPKNPIVQESLEDELIAGRDFIANLRKRFPDREIIYLEGNHENRLNRFILKNSKVFWNLLTVEKYLELKKHKIKYYPYNYKYQIEKSNCFVQHSPPSYGVNGARTSLLKKLDQSYIWGCTHREQKSCLTGASGKIHAAYFNGWLGSTTESPSHAEVFSYAKGHEDWQQAFTVVSIMNQKEHFINQYSIRDYKVVIDGHLFEE